MKMKIVVPAILIIIIAISLVFILLPKSLNSRLDDLEKIIEKYEPLFGSSPYSSEEYSDMIKEYNKEIFAWAEEFEMQRYERDENNKILYDSENKPKINPEFSGDVEKRFYILNNRMTKMVLSSVPQKERPENNKQNNEK